MNLMFIFDVLLIAALLLVSWRLLGASDLFQATVLFISFGLFLALAWVRLAAPDIALAEAAVGAGLTGVLLFGAFKAVEPKKDWRSGAEPQPCRLDLAAECPGVAHYLLVSLFVAGFAALLLVSVWSLPETAAGLSGMAEIFLAQSGVEHPVTAVLLNFRLYDTLLELGVLLLSLLGVLSLGGHWEARHARPPCQPPPVLLWLVRFMVPLMLLATAYLLWLGDHAPGGAFQAGVVLAAILVLLWLSGHGSISILPRRAWLFCLVAGFGSMLVLAVVTSLAPGVAALGYPHGWATILILVLESAATLSIGVILASLAVFVLIGRAESGNGQAEADRAGRGGD